MLNNPDTALMGVSIAALWKQIPLMTLLLLAGLQNVPSDILEAATIDGAGSLRRFFSITLPYLSPVVKVSISMSIIENFKQFPLFWTMTGGGPDGATTNLAILSYREAFVSDHQSCHTELQGSVREHEHGLRCRGHHNLDGSDDHHYRCIQQAVQNTGYVIGKEE